MLMEAGSQKGQNLGFLSGQILANFVWISPSQAVRVHFCLDMGIQPPRGLQNCWRPPESPKMCLELRYMLQYALNSGIICQKSSFFFIFPHLRNNCIASLNLSSCANRLLKCSASSCPSSMPLAEVFGGKESRQRNECELNIANWLVCKSDVASGRYRLPRPIQYFFSHSISIMYEGIQQAKCYFLSSW